MQQTVSGRRGTGEAIAGEATSRPLTVAARLRNFSDAPGRWATHSDHDGPQWMHRTHEDTCRDALNSGHGLEHRGLVGACQQQAIDRGRAGLACEGTARFGRRHIDPRNDRLADCPKRRHRVAAVRGASYRSELEVDVSRNTVRSASPSCSVRPEHVPPTHSPRVGQGDTGDVCPGLGSSRRPARFPGPRRSWGTSDGTLGTGIGGGHHAIARACRRRPCVSRTRTATIHTMVLLAGHGRSRRRFLALASVTAGALLAACETAAPSPTPTVVRRAPVPPTARPDVSARTIVHAQYADARTMQPVLARDPASAAFAALHYNAPLLRRNPETLDWDPTEGTAAAVVVADRGRSITYTLREGLSWSDGAPLTAGDYRFTYERIVDPATDHPYRSVYENVVAVEAPDDRTLIWTFREAFCPSVDYTVINPIPRHVFGGADLERHPASTRPVVGSGPFLLREWDQGTRANFEANPAFYLGRPRLDRYVIRLVADASEGWTLVKRGEADVAAILASDAADASSSGGTKLVAHYPATSSWTYLGLNLRHPILADRSVRQAIAHAVDREALIREVRLGRARPINSPFGRGSWASTVVPGIPYDPAAAERLLDAAGWQPATGGTRANDGRGLAFTLRYPSGSSERERAATRIAADLRTVGIEVRLLADRLADLVDRVNVTREYDLCILGWTVPIEPHGTRDVWTTGGLQNGSGLADVTIDLLYEEAAVITGCGRDERAQAYGEIQRRVADAIPCVFLFENQSLTATSTRIAVNPLTRLGWDYRPWEWATIG